MGAVVAPVAAGIFSGIKIGNSNNKDDVRLTRWAQDGNRAAVAAVVNAVPGPFAGTVDGGVPVWSTWARTRARTLLAEMDAREATLRSIADVPNIPGTANVPVNFSAVPSRAEIVNTTALAPSTQGTGPGMVPGAITRAVEGPNKWWIIGGSVALVFALAAMVLFVRRP